jgi:predicted RNase H-like nuclease (RuvC/YqgF family)
VAAIVVEQEISPGQVEYSDQSKGSVQKISNFLASCNRKVEELLSENTNLNNLLHNSQSQSDALQTELQGKVNEEELIKVSNENNELKEKLNLAQIQL